MVRWAYWTGPHNRFPPSPVGPASHRARGSSLPMPLSRALLGLFPSPCPRFKLFPVQPPQPPNGDSLRDSDRSRQDVSEPASVAGGRGRGTPARWVHPRVSGTVNLPHEASEVLKGVKRPELEGCCGREWWAAAAAAAAAASSSRPHKLFAILASAVLPVALFSSSLPGHLLGHAGFPTGVAVGHLVASVEHHQYHLTLIPTVGIAVTGVAMLLLVILVLLIHRKKRELKDPDTTTGTSDNTFPPLPVRKCQEGPPSMFRRFSYKETKKATDNFSLVIGKGGFGTVYRAEFSDDVAIAVKRMNKVSQQGEDEFCREMELLGRLHHRHLVALRGFCIEKRERFLMYEYMENGSLKDHLHSSGWTPLSWRRRMQIAIDVANALEYLHFYCDPPLCHRDIKSSNILLDENFVAKVADFGLAHASRSGSINFEPVNTDIRGTPGYMDPEYVVTQELTEKSDIYSYGVLLLELVTGRRAIQDNKNLVEWSQKFMVSGSKLSELVDPVIKNSVDLEQLHVVVGIIQWCTQREGKVRPSIKQVLRVLHERLDAVHRDFVKAVEDDEAEGSGDERICKGKALWNEMIPHSGDARCLPSSSSTSRSYCSRSFLLENSSPQSPPGMFSL
ncbi:hypothetical protein Taro_011847 [Colocasia esculenta]|uniref:Protein kinase domain-containing protein n=1 Tax=Colocasia esculenta TaxID=4460 RepID=A0A843UBT6_COLES|nr:hypothetical protein [Colocasia esculenta]